MFRFQNLNEVMSSSGVLSISEVNALAAEQFEWLFGNVIEHCPEAARHVSSMRPFSSVKILKKSFDDYLDKLETSEKENVLIKHPDLAGRLAEEGLLTAESQFEQKSAGLETMSREEKQMLSAYNVLYKEKFQFPFIICARENKTQTILASIQTRLQNIRDNELQIGIQEVKKICSIRIDDLVWPDV